MRVCVLAHITRLFSKMVMDKTGGEQSLHTFQLVQLTRDSAVKIVKTQSPLPSASER